MKYLVLAAIGALASILANKSIAVFNDGFRQLFHSIWTEECQEKIWLQCHLQLVLV